MIFSKILGRKNEIVNSIGKKMTDLIYGTFAFPSSGVADGVVIVEEFESMRPDLISNRIYASQGGWDALLKYNGISNPFSIEAGDILYALPYDTLKNSYVSPVEISERPSKNEDGTLKEINLDTRDKKRIQNLEKKSKITKAADGSLPPNINKPTDKSVKVKDGKLIFGEDVTSVNKKNCPVPISRSRLKAALIKDNLFL